MNRSVTIALLALLLGATACTPSNTSAEAQDQATVTPTAQPGSATILPTTTTEGGSLTTAERPTSTTPPLRPSLDLVVVGDSFVGWSEWPEMYADLASDTLGVPVVLDESLAGPGTPRRLDQIKSSERARRVIASAEILIVQPQPGWAAGPAFRAYFAGECGGVDNNDCLASLADEYGAYANEYFDLLLELVAPGTIIRVASTASWGPEGFYPELREDDPRALSAFIDGVVGMMKEAENAATSRGILTIDVSAAFNGPTYKDPAPDEFLVADRLHLDTEGSEVVARLLHELGYKPG